MAARQERSKPIIKQLKIRLKASRARVSAKSLLGNAPKYIAKFRGGLCLFRTAGRVELDNNSIQRPIVLNRKNALFAGHDARAQNRAMLASLIETCKLNAVDPQAWLTPRFRPYVRLACSKMTCPIPPKRLFPDRLERQTIHKVQPNVFLS